MKKYHAGDTATMTLYRAGAEVEVEITFDERLPEVETEEPAQEEQSVNPFEGFGWGTAPNPRHRPVTIPQPAAIPDAADGFIDRLRFSFLSTTQSRRRVYLRRLCAILIILPSNECNNI